MVLLHGSAPTSATIQKRFSGINTVLENDYYFDKFNQAVLQVDHGCRQVFVAR